MRSSWGHKVRRVFVTDHGCCGFGQIPIGYGSDLHRLIVAHARDQFGDFVGKEFAEDFSLRLQANQMWSWSAGVLGGFDPYYYFVLRQGEDVVADEGPLLCSELPTEVSGDLPIALDGQTVICKGEDGACWRYRFHVDGFEQVERRACNGDSLSS